MSQQPTEVMPDWSVVITPRQQYEELRSLTSAVNNLVAKVDPTLVDLRSDSDDHEKRIRSLEGKHTVSPAQLWTAVCSAVAMVGIIAGIVFNIVKP